MLGVQPPSGRNYGRSMVINRGGIAATSNALASQSAAQILALGGSAVDAAIAANAVLGVVEPMMNGMGGDLFAMYWEAKTGKLTGLNASGGAPKALTRQHVASRGIASMADAGIHAVTVPGAVDGWAKMHARFGKIDWSHLFRAAIAYANEGYPVPEVAQELWSAPSTVLRLEAHAESRRVFLPKHRAPEHGEIFRNPDLAASYARIALDGTDAFYRGEIGQAIVAASDAMGGTMTAADLANFSAEWAEPIHTDYHGWKIYELPPNGQGMAALEMLNIMECIPADKAGPLSATEMHRRIEAMKLAYADAYRYNADPRVERVPVDTLISKEHARERARRINRRRSNGEVEAAEIPVTDTVYLAVVDREGNIASWIQSIYATFGSGITPQGVGFMLQNRGAGFSLDPAHPNVVAGGKRPYHTIIPGFMQKGHRHIGFGIMGGANQPLAHAQFVSNVVDYGMNLQQAVETPRFFKGSSAGCDVSIEGRVTEQTCGELTDMGHVVCLRPEYSQEMGRGQAVMHHSDTGTNWAGSDARADGAATPEGV